MAKLRRVTSPAPAVLTAPAKHCFKLSAQIQQQFVGEIPGGYRIDLYYSESDAINVDVSSGLTDDVKKHLQGAVVQSGNDWVSVNDEGVVDFDSRITLKLGPGPKDDIKAPPSRVASQDDPEASRLIAGRIRGRATLRQCRDENGNRLFEKKAPTDVFRAWVGGLENGSYLPLVLAVTFDVPRWGFDEEQTEVYRQCRDLGASLFLATGKARFRQAPYGAVDSIDLDLFEIEPSASLWHAPKHVALASSSAASGLQPT